MTHPIFIREYLYYLAYRSRFSSLDFFTFFLLFLLWNTGFSNTGPCPLLGYILYVPNTLNFTLMLQFLESEPQSVKLWEQVTESLSPIDS